MAITPSESVQPRDDRDAITRSFYNELRSVAEGLMRSERRGHTLQPTAVVNEACLRIIKHGLPAMPREQQLAIGARVLEQVLIDYSRKHKAAKRGGAALNLDVADAIAAEHEAVVDFERVHSSIEKLRRLHERQAEVVTLRVFGGLTMEQIAAVIGLSKRSIENDWAIARAWLSRELAVPITSGVQGDRAADGGSSP